MSKKPVLQVTHHSSLTYLCKSFSRHVTKPVLKHDLATLNLFLLSLLPSLSRECCHPSIQHGQPKPSCRAGLGLGGEGRRDPSDQVCDSGLKCQLWCCVTLDKGLDICESLFSHPLVRLGDDRVAGGSRQHGNRVGPVFCSPVALLFLFPSSGAGLNLGPCLQQNRISGEGGAGCWQVSEPVSVSCLGWALEKVAREGDL